MNEKHQSWLEVLIRRELAEGALLPPSDEQVEHVVELKRAELNKMRDFKAVVADTRYDNMVRAANAKNN